MSPTTVQPQKLNLDDHAAGVAVDGFVPNTKSLEKFSEDLTARLDQLEAKFRQFQTPNSLRKSLRG
jgi:hypothetical protein